MGLTVTLLLGLGIFLFGMYLLEQGLQSLGDARIRQVIGRMTRRPLQSVLTGTVITGIVQSSTMVSLIVLAFASAGMIPLYNAVGVMLGANLGSTFTGWIVATVGFKLDLEGVALPLFGLSALVWVFVDRRPQVHALAGVLMGFGLLLFGLVQMKEAVEDLPQLLTPERMAQMNAPLFLLVGLVLTALIRSSAAAMMIALSALDTGLIDLTSAAAFAIGADLGTTSTTILGGLKGAPIARQLAMSHVIFNLAVDLFAFLVMLPFLPQALVFFGIDDPLYGLVLFHSSFNLLGLLVFVPLLKPYTRWLEQFFRNGNDQVTRYLHKTNPAVLEAANLSLLKELEWLLWRALSLNLRNLKIEPDKVVTDAGQVQLMQDCFASDMSFEERYRDIKRLEGALHHYIASMQGGSVSDAQIEFQSHITASAREAVYSTKALKDVRQDLVRVRHAERQESNSEFDYEATLIRQYEQLCDLIGHVHKEDYVQGRLNGLRAANEALHTRLHNSILERYKNQDLPDDELATLLNANREIWHSGLNMIEAFAELQQARSKYAELTVKKFSKAV